MNTYIVLEITEYEHNDEGLNEPNTHFNSFDKII